MKQTCGDLQMQEKLADSNIFKPLAGNLLQNVVSRVKLEYNVFTARMQMTSPDGVLKNDRREIFFF